RRRVGVRERHRRLVLLERHGHLGPGVTERPTPPLVGEFASLGDALAAAGAQYGPLPAYVDGAARLSYAAWARASDGLAAVLQSRGVGKGDVVALMLPSSIDYAVAYAATVRLGAVVTGL